VRLRTTIRWLGQSEGQWPNHLKNLAELSYFSQLAEPLEKRLKHARTVLEEALPMIKALCEDVDVDGFSWLSRAEANVALWKSYRKTEFDQKHPYARWISLVSSGDVIDFELVSSPVLASGILREGLWNRCCGAVVTSATLRALNSFDRFKMRAGLFENAHCEAVPSPFDFASNGQLDIPAEAVEANNSILHTASLIEIIPTIIDESSSTLVLFSSKAQMEQVYDAMPSELQSIILCQGYESKQRMIDAAIHS